MLRYIIFYKIIIDTTAENLKKLFLIFPCEFYISFYFAQDISILDKDTFYMLGLNYAVLFYVDYQFVKIFAEERLLQYPAFFSFFSFKLLSYQPKKINIRQAPFYSL